MRLPDPLQFCLQQHVSAYLHRPAPHLAQLSYVAMRNSACIVQRNMEF